MKRRYLDNTLKVLGILSGNQCAFPGCKNFLVEPRTQNSAPLLTGNVCHIYAISVDGPRGKAGLTEKELNSPDNLILLCRNHHALIDGRYDEYSAETLRAWKYSHETKMQQLLVEKNLQGIDSDIFSHPYFPTALVDQKIEMEVGRLQKARFFGEFDTANTSLSLARKIAEGELSGGSDEVRCCALAWCSRFLSRFDELAKAEEYWKLAAQLGTCTEVDIAKAFFLSRKCGKRAGLHALTHTQSAMSRAAALSIVSHHEINEAVIEWIKEVGFESADLTADGKFLLVTKYLEVGQWNIAKENVETLTDQDFEEVPFLHHIVALTYLLEAVPLEARGAVFKQIPFYAAGFPFASNEPGIRNRRVAICHFLSAVTAAQELGCHDAAAHFDEYAMWLELEDPDRSITGKQRLELKLRDKKFVLSVVHFGIQYGAKLDYSAIEQEIEQRIALHGGITRETALARFALVLTKKTPVEAANYVDQHIQEIGKYLDIKAMLFQQIERMKQAGLPNRAREYRTLLLKEGLTKAEEERLRSVIAEVEGSDSVETRKVQFNKSGSLNDLIPLVLELETRQDWAGLCDFVPLLFDKTGSLHDAERLAIALNNTQRTDQLIEFVQQNTDLFPQSKQLRFLYAKALYHEGELIASRSEMAKLGDDFDDPNYRTVWINLNITLGDWNSLIAFVSNEYKYRERRSAKELIIAAQIAIRVESPSAKNLLMAAAKKADNDAYVLSFAYFLASLAGWENDKQVFKWFIKAVELSGSDGPFLKMSLKEIMENKPNWDRMESDTWRLLANGEIPLFLAARLLHTSLIELMLFPALSNQTEEDLRRTHMIPSFSGARQSPKFSTGEVVAGMDATALITLSFLDLLNVTFEAFKEIHIPHTTLAWLFDEKQRATFHQPSRIKDARQIRDLVATKELEEYLPNAVPDSELAVQIGHELASMIAEAEKDLDNDASQCLVVRSAPVRRLRSFLEEEVDMTAFASVLISCGKVVEKLRQKGQLTTEETKKVQSYLHSHEKPWPNQPEISDGAVLYLDHATVSHFLHLDILRKIKAAGLRPLVSPSVMSETNVLIAYERSSNEVKEAIKRIRIAVSSRIESGTIKVGRMPAIDESDETMLSQHPTTDVFGLTHCCDLIITDDRCLNQQTETENGDAQATITTTLDILDALVDIDVISQDERWEHRTRLRRAGFIFIPVCDEELVHHLNSSDVQDDMVVETAELKAIRQSILRVRMSDWLQLPKEDLWLESVVKTYTRVLKQLWLNTNDLSEVKARSNWLVDQLDIRGWAHFLGSENGDNVVRIGRGLHILTLLTPPENVSPEAKRDYWDWVETKLLAPIREQFPDLYEYMVEFQRDRITEVTETVFNEESSQ